MPHYYFNAHGPRHYVPDRDGEILHCAEAARDLAFAVIQDMASDPLKFGDCHAWTLEVTDERTETLFTVPFRIALDR
jgi:hypothetical protein